MKKMWIGITLLTLFFLPSIYAEEYKVVSPDGKLEMRLNTGTEIKYEVYRDDLSLIAPSKISMSFNNGVVIGDHAVQSTNRRSVNETISVIAGKNQILEDIYNELRVDFEAGYSLIVRVYNEGIAYRFQTAFEGDVIVHSETADFNFMGNPSVVFPETNVDYASEDKGGYWLSMTNFERPYNRYQAISDIDLNSRIKAEDDQTRYANTPLMVIYPDTYTSGIPYKVVISESDLLDYPGLYLYRPADGTNTLSGYWPKYPNEVYKPGNMYYGHDVLSRNDYLAVTKGTRDYPWRIINVSSDDKDLLNNELVYKLATPLQLDDISWIKSGKTVWEWWHKAMLTPAGAADPANGIPANGNDNLGYGLYKYYVDWAAKNNIEYLTLDAGWSESYIRQLCAYAKGKGVGVFVWTFINQAIEDANWVKKMKGFGISGVKVDFVNRDDQIAINWIEDIAKRCADNKMLLLLHGCPKPTGLQRAYPNILNYEAVCGNESNFWNRNANPDYHLEIPFIRMLAGPFDYTPGSMRNKTKTQFSPMDIANTVPSSMGTRSHELAMYIIFDQPLGFLCDAPTEYDKYPEILEFFQNVPTVWDKTVPLSAEFGKYAVIAKQTGDDWFIAGMTNWNEKTVTVDFSFLPEGFVFDADVIKDYSNNGYPARYVAEEISISSKTVQSVRMSQGGGFVIRLHGKRKTGIDKTLKETRILHYIDFNNQVLILKSGQPLLSAQIYNLSGKLLKNVNLKDENVYEKQLNIADLNPGAYILKVITNQSVEDLKFVY